MTVDFYAPETPISSSNSGSCDIQTYSKVMNVQGTGTDIQAATVEIFMA